SWSHRPGRTCCAAAALPYPREPFDRLRAAHYRAIKSRLSRREQSAIDRQSPRTVQIGVQEASHLPKTHTGDPVPHLLMAAEEDVETGVGRGEALEVQRRADHGQGL